MVYSIAIKLSHNTEVQRDIDNGYEIKKRDSMKFHRPILNGYLLIDGQLVDKNTKIKDFNKIRKEDDLPLYTPFLGIANPGVTFGYSYCQPAYNARGTSEVTLYYNEENQFETNHRTTTVWELRYSYEN